MCGGSLASIEASKILITYLGRGVFKGIKMHSIIFKGRLYICFSLGSSFVLMNHEVVKMWRVRGNKRKMCQTADMWKCRYSPQCTLCSVHL